LGKVIFGLVMLAIGGGFIFTSVSTAREYISSQTWEPASAEILEVGWKRADYRANGRTRTGYRPTILYEFAHAGRNYTSERIKLIDRLSPNYDEQRARYDDFKAEKASGRRVTAYFNPGNPHQAVLYRTINWILVAVQAFVSAIAFLLAFATLHEAIND